MISKKWMLEVSACLLASSLAHAGTLGFATDQAGTVYAFDLDDVSTQE